MTTVQTLIDAGLFALKEPGNASLEIAKVFCCDLLSIAMSKAPENGAWVTVMGKQEHAGRGFPFGCLLHYPGRGNHLFRRGSRLCQKGKNCRL